jgi:predicted RNase H-like HicB family nuclease
MPQEGGSMTFKVVVKRGEDGYFVANCPSLKSCWSQGKSREEALRNIQEAITLYLEAPPNEVAQDETQEVVELTL